VSTLWSSKLKEPKFNLVNATCGYQPHDLSLTFSPVLTVTIYGLKQEGGGGELFIKDFKKLLKI